MPFTACQTNTQQTQHTHQHTYRYTYQHTYHYRHRCCCTKTHTTKINPTSSHTRSCAAPGLMLASTIKMTNTKKPTSQTNPPPGAPDLMPQGPTVCQTKPLHHHDPCSTPTNPRRDQQAVLEVTAASRPAFIDGSTIRTPPCAQDTLGPDAGCVLLRKEVIQPHLPVRLPCYDFVPIASPTFDSSPPQGVRPLASGVADFRDVTGGVYKARERIHRSVADLRLLATPTSWGRVADPNPN